MNLPEKIEQIYNELEKVMYPYPIFIVGGSLRDILLEKEPKDYDFSTPATPEQILECLKNSVNEQGDKRRVYLTGAKFGTLGCKILGEKVEITSFRVETYEKHNRKPKTEFITDINLDLKRRDFTINALGWNRQKGLIDNHDGITDLKKTTIRCVGQPKDRFNEDSLRILRVGRFAAQLGFDVDEYTFKKAKECSYMILNVSKERWVLELEKILMSDNPRLGLNFLMETRIFNYILPELSLQKNYNQNSKYHDFDLWEHTIRVVENTPKDIYLRWSALFHDIGKNFTATLNPKSGYTNYIFHEKVSAEIVLKYSQYFKWSNELTEKVYNIVKYHLKEESPLRPYDAKAHKKEL
jgi:tRNA nucleotidyltransferase (CCA-adding enzyme)